MPQISGAKDKSKVDYEYGPFGEVLRMTGPMAKTNPFRFSTKYEDDETDLLYYGYRYYNASTGRWLTRDPIGEQGGVNLFAFAINNPITYVDDLGLGLWPKSQKDPKGNPRPYKKPVDFQPGGPVNFAPNLPTQKLNPKSPPTAQTLAASLRRCQCTGLGAAAGFLSSIWTKIADNKLLENAMSECESAGHSENRIDWCCVISKTGVLGCVTGETSWLSMSGHVVKSPCALVEAELQRTGAYNPNYGYNTVQKTDYNKW